MLYVWVAGRRVQADKLSKRSLLERNLNHQGWHCTWKVKHNLLPLLIDTASHYDSIWVQKVLQKLQIQAWIILGLLITGQHQDVKSVNILYSWIWRIRTYQTESGCGDGVVCTRYACSRACWKQINNIYKVAVVEAYFFIFFHAKQYIISQIFHLHNVQAYFTTHQGGQVF